jgi:hypothetical protein
MAVAISGFPARALADEPFTVRGLVDSVVVDAAGEELDVPGFTRLPLPLTGAPQSLATGR